MADDMADMDLEAEEKSPTRRERASSKVTLPSSNRYSNMPSADGGKRNGMVEGK